MPNFRTLDNCRHTAPPRDVRAFFREVLPSAELLKVQVEIWGGRKCDQQIAYKHLSADPEVEKEGKNKLTNKQRDNNINNQIDATITVY